MESKKVEVSKVSKVSSKVSSKKVTLVSQILKFGATGAKNRAELSKLVFAEMQARKQLVTVRGHQIELKNVKNLVSAFVRDINVNRKGHWETYTVTENDKVLKILPN